MQLRAGLLVLLIFAPHVGDAAEKDRQVFWEADWAKAFARAKAENKPVMLCINSLDTERANNRIAKGIYRDPEFVAASRKLVMIVASTIQHQQVGKCLRFGHITCKEHRDCEKALRVNHFEQFRMSVMSQEIVSPQHAWFAPDGGIIKRIEYETKPSSDMKRTLLSNMETALKRVASGEKFAPETPADGGAPDPNHPLTESDKKTLDRLKGAKSKDVIDNSLTKLLATQKIAAQAAIVEVLNTAKNSEKKCRILRALGTAGIIDAIPAISERLSDKDALVRSFAAVALERTAHPTAIEPLMKRAKRERDEMARKNMWRALGVCAGPEAHKKAAAALLKAIKADKQTMVRKHAALALKSYSTTESKKLVVKKLETLLKGIKEQDTRGALVYTLAHIGNRKTTLPLFEKLREDTNIDYVKSYYREAIRVLKKQSSEFGRSTWFLFREDRDDPARGNE